MCNDDIFLLVSFGPHEHQTIKQTTKQKREEAKQNKKKQPKIDEIIE